MAVLVFFAWLGVSALVSWLTAFQMPDGYGNAILGMQLIGGVVSAGLMAQGLPTAIDPSTKVVVSAGRGQNYETTWPREKGMKLAIIGGVIFVVFNVGGWFLDRAMGLPARYVWKVESSARSWAREAHPELAGCLATVWNAQPETCKARYRVTTRGGAARVDLRRVTCPSPPIAACVERHLATGAITVDKRQLDSLEFAGAIEIDIELSDLRGTGPAPPAERGE